MAGLEFPFGCWPNEDRGRWEAAFTQSDRFDEEGRGAHLSVATRRVLEASYARFLTYVSKRCPERLSLPPERRIDRDTVAEYVAWRRRRRTDIVLAVELDHLRQALRLICPTTEWSWLSTIIKRISATAPLKVAKHGQITSERLYALGIKLMDEAVAQVDEVGKSSKQFSFAYRDGLIIAILALIPLRRGTFVALRLSRHLIKTGSRWSLDIPASDTKTKRPLDYPIWEELAVRIETYLKRFRPRIPGADRHDGVWVSDRGRPLSGNTLYGMLVKRTKEALGFSVNPHRFRHAAATFWSIHDPANVRGVKDLLGHASFGTTETHYIMARSRIAGRTVAKIVDQLQE